MKVCADGGVGVCAASCQLLCISEAAAQVDLRSGAALAQGGCRHLGIGASHNAQIGFNSMLFRDPEVFNPLGQSGILLHACAFIYLHAGGVSSGASAGGPLKLCHIIEGCHWFAGTLTAVLRLHERALSADCLLAVHRVGDMRQYACMSRHNIFCPARRKVQVFKARALSGFWSKPGSHLDCVAGVDSAVGARASASCRHNHYRHVHSQRLAPLHTLRPL